MFSAGLGASGCADAPLRTAEKFCGELTTNSAAMRTLPTTVGGSIGLIQLYSRMGEVAPLEVETNWSQIILALKTANEIDPNDPASAQNVADVAYRTEKPALAVAKWAQETCGIDLGSVGLVPQGPVATTTTIAG